MIKIKCETKDVLDFSQLTEFQGNLKIREDTDYEKIERSIKKHGFSFPFFVWKKGKINYVIDGHGRIGALKRMVAGDEQIPPLPVVYVKCECESEAKEMLLKLNSTYGRMTAESVKEFIEDIEINIDDIALPEGVLDLNADVDLGPEAEAKDETDLTAPGFNYNSQFGVIVMCDTEEDQEQTYNKLMEQGYTCKVVTV